MIISLYDVTTPMSQLKISLTVCHIPFLNLISTTKRVKSVL